MFFKGKVKNDRHVYNIKNLNIKTNLDCMAFTSLLPISSSSFTTMALEIKSSLMRTVMMLLLLVVVIVAVVSILLILCYCCYYDNLWLEVLCALRFLLHNILTVLYCY